MSSFEAALPEEREFRLVEQRVLALRRIGAFFERGQILDRGYVASGELTRDKIIHARVADEFVPVPSYRGIKEPRSERVMKHNIGRVSIFVPASEITEEGPTEIRTAFVMFDSVDRRDIRAMTLLTTEATEPYVSGEDLMPEIDATGQLTWRVRPELTFESEPDFDREVQWLTDLQEIIDTYDLRTLPTDDGDTNNRQAA